MGRRATGLPQEREEFSVPCFPLFPLSPFPIRPCNSQCGRELKAELCPLAQLPATRWQKRIRNSGTGAVPEEIRLS